MVEEDKEKGDYRGTCVGAKLDAYTCVDMAVDDHISVIVAIDDTVWSGVETNAQTELGLATDVTTYDRVTASWLDIKAVKPDDAEVYVDIWNEISFRWCAPSGYVWKLAHLPKIVYISNIHGPFLEILRDKLMMNWY